MNNTPDSNQNPRYAQQQTQPRQNVPRNPVPHTTSGGQTRPQTGNGYAPNPNRTAQMNLQMSGSANMNRNPNIPRNMSPQQREEYMRRLEAQRRAQGQQRNEHPKYRKRKRSKPNVGVILFAVLICGVIGVSFYQIGKNPVDNSTNKMDSSQNSIQNTVQNGEQESPAEPDSGTDVMGPEAAIPDTAPIVLYDTYTVNSADINLGDLILVNYERFYSLADTVETKSVYENKTSTYSVSTTAIRLTSQALTALNNLSDAFAADTGLNEILIVSGYRNTTDQQSIYDAKVASEGEEYAKLYVANPGYSEHHTGMACDLSFYRASDGASIPVSDHEYGYWLNEHCAEYGYILRYPDAKVDITKIGYEPWHYRYVGAPHAAVIMKAGWCLEEYIDYVKNYTLDTKLLHALSDGTIAEVSPAELPAEGYVIYYVPASGEAATEIKVPKGYEDYTVSGNNEDGFIVTVIMKGKN